MKKLTRKKEDMIRDQHTIVLEDIRSSIGLLVDGQKMIREDLARFKVETEDNFEDLTMELRSFKVKTENNFETLVAELGSFKAETKNNFKVVFKYISRVDDELQIKIEQKKFVKLDERLCLLEKILSKKKLLVKV